MIPIFRLVDIKFFFQPGKISENQRIAKRHITFTSAEIPVGFLVDPSSWEAPFGNIAKAS
jgi:hypothetical protein